MQSRRLTAGTLFPKEEKLAFRGVPGKDSAGVGAFRKAEPRGGVSLSSEGGCEGGRVFGAQTTGG